MNGRQCAAITKAGIRCPNRALPTGHECFTHAPEMQERKALGSARGGHGKSNAARAAKRIPADLRDVGSILLRAIPDRAIRDVEAGSMTPATASALSQLARAFATIYESGLVEARIAEIEATIEKRVAS